MYLQPTEQNAFVETTLALRIVDQTLVILFIQ